MCRLAFAKGNCSVLTRTNALLRVPKQYPVKRAVRGRQKARKSEPRRNLGAVHELKGKLNTFSAVSLNDASSVTLLNGLAPGLAINERVGQQVHLMRLEGHGQVQVTPSTGVDQIVRLIIVRDRQPNGAAPAYNDVMTAVSTFALPSLNNQKRFIILWDRTFQLNASAEAFSQIPFAVEIPLDFKVQFNAGTAGTVADINTNALFLLAIGTEASGTTDGILNGYLRVRYTDA